MRRMASRMRWAISGCPPTTGSSTSTLGTWAVAADNGAGSKELHVVYASPGAVSAFKPSFPLGFTIDN